MYQIIKIGDQDVPMRASAATQYRYKSVFGTDLMSALARAYNSQGNQADVAEMIPKLGYIMAMQGETGAEWGKLNMNTFLEWADSFDSTAMDAALIDIVNLYNANTKTTSTPKNPLGAGQTEK